MNQNSLLGKIELLLSASAHELIDNALKAKNVAVMNEQIRRLIEAREDTDETISLVTADLRIEQDKNAGLIATIAQDKERATTLKRADKMSQAGILVKQYMKKEESLLKSNSAIEEMKKELETFDQARMMVESAISELETSRDNVERALRIAKSKTLQVNTVEDVTKILAGQGVSGIEEWAERTKVQAGVRLEQTMARHGHLLNPQEDPAVAAELEKL